jgi:hypothetical protein
MLAGWEETRRRYLALNWICGFATWTAFGLFDRARLSSSSAASCLRHGSRKRFAVSVGLIAG